MEYNFETGIVVSSQETGVRKENIIIAVLRWLIALPLILFVLLVLYAETYSGSATVNDWIVWSSFIIIGLIILPFTSKYMTKFLKDKFKIRMPYRMLCNGVK